MAKKQKIKKRKAKRKIIKSDSEIVSGDILKSLINSYGKDGTREKKEELSDLLSRYLKQEITKHPCNSDYNILILFDNTALVKSDSDRIYRAVNKFENKKPLLLILCSTGGDSGSAYLIGKLCQEFCNEKFTIAVPRHAKSAATLLACAANEIHMGSLSELGPIDPQIERMPALGLKNSIEHIAELTGKYPSSANMFAKYLKLSIEPVQIGYYERVAESAKQYAIKLLNIHKETLGNSPEYIANELVYEYKDHGFVIDKIEAKRIFGSNVIKDDTKEYKLSNALYDIFSEIQRISNVLGYKFYFIGSVDSKPGFIKKRRG